MQYITERMSLEATAYVIGLLAVAGFAILYGVLINGADCTDSLQDETCDRNNMLPEDVSDIRRRLGD